MAAVLSDLLDPLISIAFPSACLVCGASVDRRDDGAACGACWSATRLLGDIQNSCLRCCAITPLASQADSCPECESADFDRAVSAGVYEKALAAAVWHLKHRPVAAPRALAALDRAIASIERDVPRLIVPVPQSRKRTLERGFNQAEVLARYVARRIGRPICTGVLVRSTHTPKHRGGMDRKARAATVAKAFEARIPKLIDGSNVLLVDDVLTSGSTASACAAVLKEKGAARVDVITLARAVMQSN
ncbi:MAG: ComF family protein [Pyrinomonadaceae bacterium]